MIVRDLTLSKKEYKGHPCHATTKVCPCLPCYNSHDCTPPDPRHSKQVYSDIFHCAVNWNNGCPQPHPEPVHILNRQKRCKRCGTVVKNERP